MLANEELVALKINLETTDKANRRLRQELADTQQLAVQDLVNGHSSRLVS